LVFSPDTIAVVVTVPIAVAQEGPPSVDANGASQARSPRRPSLGD